MDGFTFLPGFAKLSQLAAQEASAVVLNIQATPNPTKTSFNLTVSGDSRVPVEVRVMDINGKLLYQKKGAANRSYLFGGSFATGVYVAQVLQGGTFKTMKLIKAR